MAKAKYPICQQSIDELRTLIDTQIRVERGLRKMLNKRNVDIEELLIFVDELASMLAEAHQEDVLDDHGGDQPGTCSYCKAIVRAENLLRRHGRKR